MKTLTTLGIFILIGICVLSGKIANAAVLPGKDTINVLVGNTVPAKGHEFLVEDSIYFQLKKHSDGSVVYTFIFVDGRKYKKLELKNDKFTFCYNKYLIDNKNCNTFLSKLKIGLGDDYTELVSTEVNFKNPFEIISVNGCSSNSRKPGDLFLIRCALPQSLVTSQLVFLNGHAIGKLESDKTGASDPTLYSFRLKNSFNGKDTMDVSKCIEINKGKAIINLSVGTSLEKKTPIGDPFVLTVDSAECWRISIVIVLSVLLLGAFIWIILLNKRAILRDNSTSEKPPYSLARVQLAFWTFIILFAYCFVWGTTGGTISITAQVLFLLGISAGTKFFSGIIEQNDSPSPAPVPALPPAPAQLATPLPKKIQNDDCEIFYKDIMSDKNGYSIARVQNVLFTIAVGTYFIFQVIITKRIPDIDTNLIILMAISSTAYVAVKQGENK
ncbi:MAG: hypothetical protein WCL00_12720 [Bacteroidota bacterium]